MRRKACVDCFWARGLKIVWIVGFVGSAAYAKSGDSRVYAKLETFAKVLSYVEANYIEGVDAEGLLDNAIKGLLSSLDPHTQYLPPEMNRALQEGTAGEYGGVGIEVSIKNGVLTVVTPLEGTRAAELIKPGDQIVKINGEIAKGLTLQEAISKIRGPRGSWVTFVFMRDGQKDSFEVKLKRERIQIMSVQGRLLDQFYGYIKVKSFQENTDREVRKLLKDLRRDIRPKGAALKGLILDLRNNSGGLLEQAVSVTDIFLEQGSIVSTKGRNGTFQEVKLARAEGTERDLPLIILVNEGTASAAEIVAGALQDHGRAVVLGRETFGKGSVQTLIDLDNGAALKLTVARYYTPKGRSIQALGIVPDILIAQAPPIEGPIKVREKDLQGHIESSHDGMVGITPTVVRDDQGSEDFQLGRALEYLKTWQVFQKTVVGAKSS